MTDRPTSRRPATGPLAPHPRNPRYFADGEGRPVLLVGSHSWANFASDPGRGIDYEAYLDVLERHGHNFFRGWVWDVPHSRQGPNGGPFRWSPAAWRRTGPGLATDGLPRFDLGAFDEEYFDRIRRRTLRAGERGFYVAVMLFQGFAWQFDRTDDDGFPFDGRNNVNGVDAGRGGEAATLRHPRVVAAQEAYVDRLLDAVGDLPNVLWEIANEAPASSTAWQRHLIRYLHDAESRRPLRHPVGMTFQFEGGTLEDLRASGADWISPDCDPATRADPPIADGAPITVFDTDHGFDWRSLRAAGPAGWVDWAWRHALRGHHLLFMDPYLAHIEIDGEVRNAPIGHDPREPYFGREPDPFWDPLRAVLGRVGALGQVIDLARAAPHPELAEGGCCLADPGREYCAYAPTPALELRLEPGRYRGALHDPASDAAERVVVEAGAEPSVLVSPYPAGTLVVLRRDRGGD